MKLSKIFSGLLLGVVIGPAIAMDMPDTPVEKSAQSAIPEEQLFIDQAIEGFKKIIDKGDAKLFEQEFAVFKDTYKDAPELTATYNELLTLVDTRQKQVSIKSLDMAGQHGKLETLKRWSLGYWATSTVSLVGALHSVASLRYYGYLSNLGRGVGFEFGVSALALVSFAVGCVYFFSKAAECQDPADTITELRQQLAGLREIRALIDNEIKKAPSVKVVAI